METTATERPTASTGDGEERHLTFGLAGEVYALPILDITEILAYRPLTTVPTMPTFLRGVINLRGRVVPVVDLATRFGHPGTEIARRTGIVIVETPGTAPTAEHGRRPSTTMGLLVDGVHQVLHLTRTDIVPPPSFGSTLRVDFISGMAKHDDQFVIILDAARVLSVDDLAALDRAVQSDAARGLLAEPRPRPAHDLDAVADLADARR